MSETPTAEAESTYLRACLPSCMFMKTCTLSRQPVESGAPSRIHRPSKVSLTVGLGKAVSAAKVGEPWKQTRPQDSAEPPPGPPKLPLRAGVLEGGAGPWQDFLAQPEAGLEHTNS